MKNWGEIFAVRKKKKSEGKACPIEFFSFFLLRLYN